MNPGGWAAVGTLGTGLLTAIGALVKVLLDRRLGISGDERQARQEAREDRRDTIADRDALVDQLQEEISSLTSRVEGLTTRADQVLRELEAERAYSRILVDHIYRGAPPPPPPRPAT